jgi:hypothetical protein
VSGPLRVRVSTRWVATPVLALLFVVGWGAPAAADPAGPTHYDSRITGLDGADAGTLGVRFEVLGGDAFLVVRADPGTEVEVPGYEGEPYVRIGPDGTVEVNQRSPSRWINDDRYETTGVDMPGDVDVEAPPRWEAVTTAGAYAWHDHRIHWMAPSLPGQVDPSAGTPQPVQTWAVPLTVDGQDVTLTGELVWLPGPSAAVPVGVLALAVVAGLALAWARPSWVPGVIGGASLLGLGAGVAANVGLPPGADGERFLAVLPVLAFAVLAGGLLVARRDAAGAVRGRLIAAAAGIPLLVWAIIQTGALTRPIVPGALPAAAVRVTVGIAVAAGIAGLATALRTALAATALDHDEAPATS